MRPVYRAFSQHAPGAGEACFSEPGECRWDCLNAWPTSTVKKER